MIPPKLFMHALQQRGFKIASHLLYVTGGIIIFIDMLTRVSSAIDRKTLSCKDKLKREILKKVLQVVSLMGI